MIMENSMTSQFSFFEERGGGGISVTWNCWYCVGVISLGILLSRFTNDDDILELAEFIMILMMNEDVNVMKWGKLKGKKINDWKLFEELC